MIKIAPSLLSADFSRLADDIKTVKTADYLHFDVMDGPFVPNISVGIPVLKSIRSCTDAVLDVHLMIERPVRYIKAFADAGADIIVSHVEADQPQNIIEAIETAKNCGKKAGLALKPKTPAEVVLPYIRQLDMVVVMTVEPGFGGQSFMADQMYKVAAVRKMIDKMNPGCELEVDGGVNPETAKLCINAGANVLVAGSDVFRAAGRAARIRELKGER